MLTILSILILFTLPLKAPDDNRLMILKKESIQPFKPLIRAIGAVECRFDTLAYNTKERAVGYFQIRPIRVRDYNKRTGRSYKLNDMYDYQIAEKVFLYYACQIGPYDFEKIAKNWNGSGEMTVTYWNKVKKQLIN